MSLPPVPLRCSPPALRSGRLPLSPTKSLVASVAASTSSRPTMPEPPSPSPPKRPRLGSALAIVISTSSTSSPRHLSPPLASVIIDAGNTDTRPTYSPWGRWRPFGAHAVILRLPALFHHGHSLVATLTFDGICQGEGDPHKTIGIIELLGASAQLMFVSDEVLPLELSTNFTFGETTYTLYSNNFLNFGQNAAQHSYHEILKSRGSSKNGTLVDPCAPKGYSRKRKVMARTSGASRSNLENQYVDNGSETIKNKCEHRQCHLGSNFVPELLGHFLATENFYFTSKTGLHHHAILWFFGEQLCNKDLSTLKQKYLNHSDEDFSRYCFSSAYIVALLHDSLGVPLDDKRQAYHTRTPSFFLS
ncbi:hypothetical protein ZWY2020_042284 [Hordeum vulgare]|nr:hypothetical protein ZWY2020_042284 [Hordeum vulgare]